VVGVPAGARQTRVRRGGLGSSVWVVTVGDAGARLGRRDLCYERCVDGKRTYLIFISGKSVIFVTKSRGEDAHAVRFVLDKRCF